MQLHRRPLPLSLYTYTVATQRTCLSPRCTAAGPERAEPRDQTEGDSGGSWGKTGLGRARRRQRRPKEAGSPGERVREGHWGSRSEACPPRSSYSQDWDRPLPSTSPPFPGADPATPWHWHLNTRVHVHAHTTSTATEHIKILQAVAYWRPFLETRTIDHAPAEPARPISS